MVDEAFAKMSKQSWYRWSFYMNIILFLIIIISIVFLVRDSIDAGRNWEENPGQMLLITRDVGFLIGALALVFFQFFRNLRIIMRRSL